MKFYMKTDIPRFQALKGSRCESRLARVRSVMGRLAIAVLLCWGCWMMAAGDRAIAAPVTNPTVVNDWLHSIPRDYYTVGDTNALKRYVQQQNPLLIDVREPREYRRGHLPDAVNVPLRDLAEQRDRLPSDRPLVLYCSTGYRTALGIAALRLLGVANAYGYTPSYQAWLAAGEAIDRKPHNLSD